jgi:lipopolysaccharide/colanic/teichoic acid biosynthesis glycosyltransferase
MEMQGTKQMTVTAGGEYKVSRLGMALKRAFDLLVAVVGLLVFSPLILIIYIAIRREDGGAAIFKQKRVGLGGKEFMLYKFRSMIIDSEADGTPALCKDNDDRLTKVGAFLRAHHLDELPQLWNVLRGDMSVVGYRPERRYFVDRIMEHDQRYELLFQMRPGLFSSATLYNGYTDTMEKMLERLRLDLEYLRDWSLWHDVKIIALTTYSIISGKKF